jgi:hypothetical protein
MPLSIINKKLNRRDKAILIGLYLSKFDKDGLDALGFDSFSQAFNALGYSVGSKPASIKNYRDEFDPFFTNPRMGWHKRPIRDYCKEIMKKNSKISFSNFTEIIASFLLTNYEVDKQISDKDWSKSIAKRLITGKAAEEYFKSNYKNIPDFKESKLTDSTNMACGFDFKLIFKNNCYYIEVKGLNTNSGNILMTEKEYLVAQNIGVNYCLFIVLDFASKPYHKFYFNPISSSLAFSKIERQIVQINYTATL